MAKQDKKKKQPVGRMGPLAFMRRYNKIIMVGAGVFLMIAFLIPGALQRLGRNVDRRVMFYLDEKPVRGKVYFRAQRELQLLEMLGVPIAEDIEGVLGIDRIAGPEHWIMLKRLAEEGGYVGSVAQGRELFVRSSDPRLTEDVQAQLRLMFDRASRRAGLSEEDAGRVGAYYGGVMRLLTAYAQAAKVSPLRTIAFADRLEDDVVADVLFVPPAQVLDEVQTPPVAELAQLAYEHRDELPGSGEFGIGYRQPAQMKYEYLAIREQVVEQTADIDPIIARKHFLLNQEKYAQGVNKPVNEVTYDEVRRKVISDLRRDQVDQKLNEIERFVIDELSRARKGLPTDGRHYVLPEDWSERQVGFEALAGEIAQEFGIDRPEVVRRAGDWTAIESLGGGADTVEASFLTIGKEQVDLADLLLRLKEVGEVEEGSYQVGIAIGPLHDNLGNSYMVRVLAARPARPVMPAMPEDVEDPTAWLVAQWDQLEPEVQQQITQDARELRAYEVLAAQQDAWRQRALDEGLEVVAENTQAMLVRGRRIPRARWDGSTPSVDNVGTNEQFVEALHQVVSAVPPTANVAEQLPLPQRTVVEPIPAKRGLALAQVTAREPLTDRDYRLQVALGLSQRVVTSERADLSVREPFSFVALAERMEFRPAGRQRDMTPTQDGEGEQMEAGEEQSTEAGAPA